MSDFGDFVESMTWIEWVIASAIVAITVCCLGFSVFQVKMECDTFNKFKEPTTPEATFWDAAFSELRVEAR